MRSFSLPKPCNKGVREHFLTIVALRVLNYDLAEPFLRFAVLYLLTIGSQGYAFFADFRPFVKLFEMEKSDPKSRCDSDFAAIIKHKCNRLVFMEDCSFRLILSR